MPSTSLFEHFKTKLSEGDNQLYNPIFSTSPEITSLADLMAKSHSDLAKRSDQTFSTGSGIIDSFVNNFANKITDATSPCDPKEISSLFRTNEEIIFNDFLLEMIQDGFTSNGTTFGSLSELIRFVIDNRANTTIIDSLKEDIKVKVASAPCQSILHQSIATFLEGSVSTFIANAKKQLDVKIKLPLDEGAENIANYIAEIIDADGNVIHTAEISEDGTITFSDEYYDIADLNASEQLSFTGNIRIVDKYGNNANTIKNADGDDFVLTFPPTTLPIIIEKTNLNSLTLSSQVSESFSSFFTESIQSAFFTNIDGVFPSGTNPFSSGFTTWFTGVSNTNYKTINAVLNDPEGFTAAAGSTNKLSAEAFIALCTFSLITSEIKVAARLVEAGLRSFVDITSKRPEEIVQLESVDDYDVNQVGDYQLFEAYEMARVALDILDNQIIEINTQYDK